MLLSAVHQPVAGIVSFRLPGAHGSKAAAYNRKDRPLIALYFFHLETGLFYMKSFHLRIHSGRTQLFLDPEKLIVLCDALASAGSTGLDLTGI